MFGKKPLDVSSFNIFEVKRKGVRDDVLASNFLFYDKSMTRVSIT